MWRVRFFDKKIHTLSPPKLTVLSLSLSLSQKPFICHYKFTSYTSQTQDSTSYSSSTRDLESGYVWFCLEEVYFGWDSRTRVVVSFLTHWKLDLWGRGQISTLSSCILLICCIYLWITYKFLVKLECLHKWVLDLENLHWNGFCLIEFGFHLIGC